MNKLERRSVLGYELIGIAFIIILGSIFHFTFELSGHQPIVGVFSAVNESVWEHFKLAFWPAVAYIIFEYKFLKKSTNNFFSAKTVGIYLMPIVIAILFYMYTAILGEDLLIMDILTFVIAVIVGQLSSYKLLVSNELPRKTEKISFLALIILGLAFVLFTFYPPHLSIFRDPVTGNYGIT